MSLIDPIFDFALDLGKLWFSIGVIAATAAVLSFGFRWLYRATFKLNRNLRIGLQIGVVFGVLSSVGYLTSGRSGALHWSSVALSTLILWVLMGLLGLAFGALVWWLKK